MKLKVVEDIEGLFVIQLSAVLGIILLVVFYPPLILYGVLKLEKKMHWNEINRS